MLHVRVQMPTTRYDREPTGERSGTSRHTHHSTASLPLAVQLQHAHAAPRTACTAPTRGTRTAGARELGARLCSASSWNRLHVPQSAADTSVSSPRRFARSRSARTRICFCLCSSPLNAESGSAFRFISQIFGRRPNTSQTRPPTSLCFFRACS